MGGVRQHWIDHRMDGCGYMKRRVERKEKIFLLGLAASGKPGCGWDRECVRQKAYGLLGGG